jgi:protein-disulfide isomerase
MHCNKDLTRTFHEHACEFAKAVECAAKQGMFWQMNDALFSVQDLVPPGKVNLERLAVQLGVDRSAFKDCMTQESFPKRISDDLEDSRRLKIQGTPTYFIGSLRMEGGVSKEAIEEALAQSNLKETP